MIVNAAVTMRMDAPLCPLPHATIETELQRLRGGVIMQIDGSRVNQSQMTINHSKISANDRYAGQLLSPGMVYEET